MLCKGRTAYSNLCDGSVSVRWLTHSSPQIAFCCALVGLSAVFLADPEAFGAGTKAVHHAAPKHARPNSISAILNNDQAEKSKPGAVEHLNKEEALKKLSVLSQRASISEARTLLKELIEEYGQDADVHLAAGDFYRSIGSLALAIDQYSQAIKLNGRRAQAYMGLAQIYLTNNLDSLACDCARQACLLEPDSAEAQLVYVNALLKTDRMRQADKELGKLLSKPGQITNANIAYVAYQVYRKRGQFASAENYLNQAIALDPKQNQWLVEKAELCELRQDYQGARTALETALKADPYSISALYQLGLILERDFQDYDGAISQFEKLLKIDPDYVDAVAQIDLCRTRKNDLAGQLKLELWRQIEGFNGVFTTKPKR